MYVNINKRTQKQEILGKFTKILAKKNMAKKKDISHKNHTIIPYSPRQPAPLSLGLQVLSLSLKSALSSSLSPPLEATQPANITLITTVNFPLHTSNLTTLSGEAIATVAAAAT